MAAAPAPLSVRVLGGGRDVGRSCLLLTLGTRHVLLDCGAHPGYADARRFPDLQSLPPLDAVLVTHFHLDHAGALPLLRALQRHALSPSPSPSPSPPPPPPPPPLPPPPPPPPVLMTAPTRAMTALMLRDFYDTSAARRQALPFSGDDVRHALDAVVELPLTTVYSPPLAPDLTIEAYYAGHVLGAVMFRVAVAGAGVVVYSGDYTTTPDALLRAADVPPPAAPVDLFITEATYCGTIRRAPRSAAESELVAAVVGALRAGGKVLIPVSALGRAHELIAVLAPLWIGDAAALADVPVFAAAGLMAKAAAVYDSHAADWCCGGAAAPPRIAQMREFQRGRDWPRVLDPGPMLMFATPGNLSTGVSLDVFRAWCGDARNVVVVPGFCFANTLAARLLAGGAVDGAAGDIRCRLLNMSLGAHADARGIARTARRLRPHAVMLVHGEDGKIAAFAPRLRQALGGNVSVHAPGNGDTVTLRAAAAATAVPRKRRRFATKAAAGAETPPDEPLGPLEAGRTNFPYSARGDRLLDSLIETQVRDPHWRAVLSAYAAGAGHHARRHRGPGAATRPVADGVSALSRLYATLLPEVERVAGSATDFVYRGRVTVRFERARGEVRVTWTAGRDEGAADALLAALEDAASPPCSPRVTAAAADIS